MSLKFAAGTDCPPTAVPAAPSWPAIPLDGDRLRDAAIRTAGGLLALHLLDAEADAAVLVAAAPAGREWRGDPDPCNPRGITRPKETTP